MIPQVYIEEWKESAPWILNRQVEQDLILSRVLVELFSSNIVRNSLAFRGGTALYKLFIRPAARYSEDIDLVQLRKEPIGKVINTIQDLLKPLLGDSVVRRWEGRVTVIYRFNSEEIPHVPMRLKIEINTNEHFQVLGIHEKMFNISNSWFSGECSIPTYDLHELAATKLKALYQRKKGRDLLDMSILANHKDVDNKKIVDIFLHYVQQEKSKITRAQFEKNLFEKMHSPDFLEDIEAVLAPDRIWNPALSSQQVYSKVLSLLPGDSMLNQSKVFWQELLQVLLKKALIHIV